MKSAKSETVEGLLTSGSMLALVAAGLIGLPSPASANCTVNGSLPTPNDVQSVPAGAVVDCAPGVETRSWDGRADSQSATPAVGFTATILDGATLVAPGTTNPAALFFGPGSTLTVEKGGRIQGPGGGVIGVVTTTGQGNSITNHGTISVNGNGPAINGAFRDGEGPSVNLNLVNTGVIETVDPTLDIGIADVSTVNASAAPANVVNSGSITRRGVSGSALTIGGAGTLVNSGEITFTLSGSGTSNIAQRPGGDGLRISGPAGTSVTNTGVIRGEGDNGSGIAIQGAPGTAANTAIVNDATGRILGTGGAPAINAAGDNITVRNSGELFGGAGNAVVFRGENARLQLMPTATLTGDVRATTIGQVLRTMQELGLDPNNPAQVAGYNRLCLGPSPSSRCFSRVNKFPDLATVEFQSDTPIAVDPNVTEFVGINHFILTGKGPLTISQDFVAGNHLDPSATNQALTGNFGGTLEFEVTNPDAAILLPGVISDNPNDPNRFKGSLRKTGDGTAILTGENTYSGGTTIDAGILQIGDGNARGSIIGDVVNNGALRFQRLGVTTFGGEISGSGQLVATEGTVLLTGENTYTGGTQMISITAASGRPTTPNITIGNGGTSGSIVGDVVNNGGSLSFRRSDDIVYGGVVSGTGSLGQSGTGTLTLTGNSTYTGGTSVGQGGTLILNGSLTSDISVFKSIIAPRGSRVGGTGSTTGSLTVAADSAVAPGVNGVGNLTVGDFNLLAGGILEVDAIAGAGNTLLADSLTVNGTATFGETNVGAGAPFGPSLIDVKFDANAPLPDFQGITILSADGGVKGLAPHVILDPASLPSGQNFHLSLEATNLGGTFAGPGELIPTGAGGQGFVVLQINKDNPVYLTPPQVTVINAPYLVPTGQPLLAPSQVPALVPPKTPGAQPYLVPTLVQGPTANVLTNVVPTTIGQISTPTGIRVTNGGVQLGGGTLTPTPQTTSGTPITPTSISVGTTSTVVVVAPPKGIPTNAVSIIGSYGAVNQANARPGTQYALIYKPHEVLVSQRPADYGNLSPLGVSQTQAQRQVGSAINQLLPLPQQRAANAQQAILVGQLYPLSVNQILAALDSIAGTGTDPTFTTVLNGRMIQSAIDTRLQGYRDGKPAGSASSCTISFATEAERPANCLGGIVYWGQGLGAVGSGNYLQDADRLTGGFALGADAQIDAELVAGAAVGFVSTSIDPAPGGNDDVSTLEAAGYANWTDGAWFASGLAGFGYHWLNMDRAIVIGGPSGIASGSADAWGFFAGMTAGRRFETELATIEPSVGFRYDFVDRKSFTESGSGFGDRRVDSETLNSALAFIGVRVFKDFEAGDNLIVSPELRLGYAREIGDTNIDGTASFVNAPGSSFPVLTKGPGDDVGIFGARLTGTQGNTSFFVDYQGDVRKDYMGHAFRAGLTFAF